MQGELPMDGVPQCYLRELKRWVKRFTQRHVEQVPGKSELLGGTVLAIRIDALGVEDGLNLVEENRVQGRKAFWQTGYTFDSGSLQCHLSVVDLGIPSLAACS